MMYLKGDLVYLRALEPEDLEFVHAIENNELHWELSNTIVPYAKYTIKDYISNSTKSIFETGQLRLVISAKSTDTALGLIDLFEFDALNKRAGIGIVIALDKDKQKGFASEALKLMLNYAFKRLQLHQVYCNILETNAASMALFEKHDFLKIGLKKEWILSEGSFKNEYLYQRIR